MQSCITKISAPTVVHDTTTALQVPLLVQSTVALLSLADWQVLKQEAKCPCMTTGHTSIQVRDQLGCVKTVKPLQVTGTSTVSRPTVY